jgi:hypothetical protein
MRTFRYQDLDGEHTLTEFEILLTFYPWWAAQMRKAGKPESDITEEFCLGDWIIVHWAWQVDP